MAYVTLISGRTNGLEANVAEHLVDNMEISGL